MFTQELLQELVAYNPNQGNILSLYLDTDSTQQSIDTIKLQAKGLLKEVQANHSQETSAIERYLDHNFDWPFSLRQMGSFSGLIQRPFPFATDCVWDKDPTLNPWPISLTTTPTMVLCW